MKHIVQRTCTEVSGKGENDRLHIESQSFSEYQRLPAYVLLGDPGAGKTTAFKQEAEQKDACYVTARDLITFQDRLEWHGKILFIDGLDEIRAGTSDTRTPFDAIRTRLDSLGCPRFRLSCREADWFGATDQESLGAVSPDTKITILRLDPLSEENVEEILNHDSRVTDAADFMRSIKQRGLSDLVTNPQILNMLVKAVAGENAVEWPKTRKQTFEIACKTIVREHNPLHEDLNRTHPASDNQIMDAAGFLCAVQLIAGNAGYSKTQNSETCDYPYFGEVDYGGIKLLSEAYRTKLFAGIPDDRFEPVHRSIAEYLAANYLAERIDKRALPVGRVLALITGGDGVVVAELRGLSAWLATLCISQRRTVIKRDSLGAILYGDVQGFNTEDKRYILACLKKEADRYTWFRTSNRNRSSFGALATSDMETEFQRILEDSDRSKPNQVLVDCVLDAMAHGVVSYPSLDGALLDIIRDASRRPPSRSRALEVFTEKNSGTPEKDNCLKELLEEINDGMVVDSDDTLLGYLLPQLYPRLIPAHDVLNFLHTPKKKNLLGGYVRFWRKRIIELSSNTNVSLVLDELVSRLELLRPVLNNSYLRSLPTGMLARGLMTQGQTVNVKRLYGWLGVGLDRHGWQYTGDTDNTNKIKDWLEVNGTIQKEIILHGLRECKGKEDITVYMYTVHERLYHANRPSDFGLWCLNQIKVSTDDGAIQYFFQQAAMSLWSENGNDGLSLELLEKIAQTQPKYGTWLTGTLTCSVPAADIKYVEANRIREAQEEKHKQEWLGKVREQQTDLYKGQTFPQLMNDIAIAYEGRFTDSEGDTPQERLENYLGQDKKLVSAALEGLPKTLDRDDLPELMDIFKLNAQDRTYLLSRPYLAGLKEATKDNTKLVHQLTDDQIRRAIAFYLVDMNSEDPEWYKSLLNSRSDLVSEVMAAYVSMALKSNKQHISGVYELCYDYLYASVAKSATLIMLKAFPARSTNAQLSFLEYLLKAALRHADRQAFLKLIDKKLTFQSMNIAQRVYWVTAGLIAAPETFKQVFIETVDRRESRVQHLANFLGELGDNRSFLGGLPVSTLGLLIGVIGEFFAPYDMKRGGWVSPGMSASDLVRSLITRMGSYPDETASITIAQLCSDSKLNRWQYKLKETRFEQSNIRREAGFHHPDLHKVVKTLKNLSPANAGDLAALTMDVLRVISDRIRNGSTNDYRLFWEGGPENRQHKQWKYEPKYENECRDVLLSDLKQCLAPLGVDAQAEAYYADEKRADIRISFGGAGGFEVPVEIKKNSSPDLWKAIQDQLISRYTREPNTDGFGIFLVFWFGEEYTKLAAEIERPQTAIELEDCLRETLNDEENEKISICVVDVARPKA